MRKTWKVALAFTLALGLGGAIAQAQPLITGNVAAFGCGPILTTNFSTGLVEHSFYPFGAGGDDCSTGPINHHNGRGLTIGGLEVFYTELDETHPGDPFPGFGGSEFIHVTNYNAGVGSTTDTRLLVNPRPGSGIQNLTFSNAILYALTGYDYQDPIVYRLNYFSGSQIGDPVPIERVGFVDDSVDGFAVLPNGNFLANNMGTSCIYAEYDKTDGHFIGNIINVPGGPARCTGVDTDGTSLFFLTDFTAVTRTDFAGNMTGFNFFDGPGGENFVEDISLVHPVTTITDVADGHLWLGLKNSDDQGTQFDLKVELLVNGTPVPGATALTRCITELTRNPSFAKDVIASFPVFPSETLVSGDVVGFRFWTRVGTDPDDTQCSGPGGSHRSAVGIKLYYDSANRASYIPVTIAPNPEQTFYLHSDGGPCPGGSSDGSPGVTTQFLDDTVPAGSTPKCGVSGSVDFFFGNVFSLIGTWSLAPLP